MKRGLKQKFFFLFSTMFGVIFIIVAVSIYNLLRIKSTTDTLMTDNYSSIGATSAMATIVDKQNTNIVNFINTKSDEYRKEFYILNGEFYKQYTFQSNNVTEKGESNGNNNVRADYDTFMEKSVKVFKGEDRSAGENLQIYMNEVQPQYMSLKENLKYIENLNEEGLLNKQQNLKDRVDLSIYTMVFLSIILMIFTINIFIRYINKFLEPIVILKEDMIKSKQSGFLHKTNVLSDDEVGLLAKEFNKMNEKINEFKNSTLGKIMEEKNKSEAIVESISDPIVVLDENFRVISLNDCCEKEFNLSHSVVRERHILEVITNGELFDCIASFIKYGEEKTSKIISIENTTYDVTLCYFMDIDKKKRGLIVYFHNITEIKRVETMKQEFISSLSHEIKTPLTSLIMGASILEESDIDNKYKKIVKTISDDGDKILTLVNNFLRIHEIESYNNLLNMDNFSIIQLIEGCLDGFYTLADSKEIKILTEYDEDIPRIMGDMEKLGWVINNLLSNAIKYSNNEGTVKVTVRKNKNNIEIYVKDNGIGISKEDHPKIFDKFYRGVDDTEGTGLGLALSKELIELHKGYIECESILGTGSLFRITLPIGGDIDEEA